MRRLAAVLLGWTLLGAAAEARQMDVFEHAAVTESLSRVHPRLRGQWLADRGLDNSYYTTFRKPESTGLREIGRWPWGPSWELCGRDSLLFLGSGSGVRILSITDSVHPRMLGQIVARGLVSQLVVRDSLLFVACGSWGAQVYSVSDPANPRELGSMEAVIGDLAVVDTFCYTLGGDSLRIYSIADPDNPVRLGAVRDSGDLIVVTNGHAFCAGRWLMNIYNVTNPAGPVWANSRGGPCYAMHLRGNLLFCTAVQPDYFAIIDVTDPTSLRQVGGINGYGGDGVFADNRYAYLSCNYEHSGFFVIDIADSSHPALRDSLDPEGVTKWDIYVPRPYSYGYLADDYGGLVAIDLHDANSISEAWSGYKASYSVDIAVDGGRGYVGNYLSGLQVLDVSEPTRPTTLGLFDVVGAKVTYTATGRDSFAYIGMSGVGGQRYLRVLSVIDPANPILVAQESCLNPPQDIVLRDTWLYAAEMYQFQVFNVARPREPVLVGSCVTQEGVWGLSVLDTLAFIAGVSLQVVNVAEASAPRLVGTIDRGCIGVAVKDTFAYVPSWDTLFVYTVADPVQARLLSSTPTGRAWDVALCDSLLFIGTNDGVEAYSISNPTEPRRTGQAAAPHSNRRLCYAGGYLYSAIWDAGVAVYETTTTGLAEYQVVTPDVAKGISATPNPASRIVRLAQVRGDVNAAVHDAVGRVRLSRSASEVKGSMELDVARLPPGVYFAQVNQGSRTEMVRFVKH